jgi:hypothetical protein
MDVGKKTMPPATGAPADGIVDVWPVLATAARKSWATTVGYESIAIRG